MNRKDFLKNIGAVGLVSGLPLREGFSKSLITPDPTACVLIPKETEGPFPLDLTENSTFFRQIMNESKTGVPLNVKLKIIGSNNCLPMQNVRVNIWHCDKDGLYSGYSVSNNQGQAGLTYCRAYQFTDANGIVEFKTIFPGWYTGRICHIHFKVSVSSSYAVVSQLTFPITEKNNLYKNNASLYTKGQDPLSFNQDNIFSDGYNLQVATLTQGSNNEYSTYLEVTVDGTGVLGVGHLEKENAKNFVLFQNTPNPVSNETIIPFKIIEAGNAVLDLYTQEGKRICQLINQYYQAGDYQVPIDFNKLGIPAQNCLYQFELKNQNGIYKDVKMITFLH